jgi:hypothetical protein
MALQYISSGGAYRFGKKQALDRSIELTSHIDVLENLSHFSVKIKPIIEDLKVEREVLIKSGLPSISERDLDLIEFYFRWENLEQASLHTGKTRQECSRKILRFADRLREFGAAVGTELPEFRKCESLLNYKDLVLVLIAYYDKYNK